MKSQIPNPNYLLDIGHWKFIGIIGIYWILEINFP